MSPPEDDVELDSYGSCKHPPPVYSPEYYSPMTTSPSTPLKSPEFNGPFDMSPPQSAYRYGDRLSTIPSESPSRSMNRLSTHLADSDSPTPEGSLEALRRSKSVPHGRKPLMHHHHIPTPYPRSPADASIEEFSSMPASACGSSRQRTPALSTFHDTKDRFHRGTSAKVSRDRTPSGGSHRAYWRPHLAWSGMSGNRPRQDVEFPGPFGVEPVFPKKRNTLSIVITNTIAAGYLLTDLYFTLEPSSYPYRIIFSTGAGQGLECAVTVMIALISSWIIGGVLMRHKEGMAAERRMSLRPGNSTVMKTYSGSSNCTLSSKRMKSKVASFVTVLGLLSMLPLVLLIILGVLHKKTPPIAPSPLCSDMGYRTTIDLDATSPDSPGFANIYTSSGYNMGGLHMNLYAGPPPLQNTINVTTGAATVVMDNLSGEGASPTNYNFTGSYDTDRKFEIIYETAQSYFTINKLTLERNYRMNKTYWSIEPIVGTYTNDATLEFPNLKDGPVSRNKDWRRRAFSPKLDFELVPWVDRDIGHALFRFVGDKRLGNGENVDCTAKVRACAMASFDSDEVLVPAGVLLIELSKVKNCYR